MPKQPANQGIKRLELAVGASVARAGLKVRSKHLNTIRKVNRAAKANFEADVTGSRWTRGAAYRRQSGAFTFGTGRTFQGFLFDERNSKGRVVVSGFGYPNVARADARTDYVWRSLEYGLKGGKYRPVDDPLAPRGTAKFPLRFTFDPFGGRGGMLIPKTKGAAEKGALVRPQAKARGRRPRASALKTHPGIRAKRFIKRAGDQVLPSLPKEYQKEITTAFVEGM